MENINERQKGTLMCTKNQYCMDVNISKYTY